MNTTRKLRRMARDPQPPSGKGKPTAVNADVDLASGGANPPEFKPARITKQSVMLDILGREGGASLTAIVEATYWLPHTARAALTGLRKKGHTIERFRSDDETRYRILSVPSVASIDTTIAVGDEVDDGCGSIDSDVDADREAVA